MKINARLIPILSCLLVCVGSVATADTTDMIEVSLPCTTLGWYLEAGHCEPETIYIPNGRPIYALLVSGFHQNRNLDMFHYYNFARCLNAKGAYVHYAWWNNLLAPYMEEPLHYEYSVPSISASPHHDLFGFIYGWNGEEYPNKAIPADDYQFQQDAAILLQRIHEENPDAAIVLVGHSMGGDAVARLAAYISYWHPDIEITLLAPIDPVGNRTCLPSWPLPHCKGYDTFKRYYVVRQDNTFVVPAKLQLGPNIKYLYHRWQIEWFPPFDLFPGPPLQTEWFDFNPPRPRIPNIAFEGTNVQAAVDTDLGSGYAAHPNNSGGWIDGHGEIVGFRGVKPWSEESWALGLDAPHNWPSLERERSYVDEPDRKRVRDRRVALLESWEDNPYLFDLYWAPEKPLFAYCNDRELYGDYCSYCMVSGDLCTILKTKLFTAPTADAGSDQTVECGGPDGTDVTVDASGSSDPDGNDLTCEWTSSTCTFTNALDCLTFATCPFGANVVTLVVNDGQVDSDPDEVNITVEDTTPPTVSPPSDLFVESDTTAGLPMADSEIQSWLASAEGWDLCSAVTVSNDAPPVFPVGLTVVTFTAVDDSGNQISATSTVTVALGVDVEIEPGFCPNYLKANRQSFRVAIVGSSDLDVYSIDHASVRLEGVAPIGSMPSDVAAPHPPEQDVCDCTITGSDGITDKALRFKTADVLAALAAEDEELVLLTLTGNLADGTPFAGSSCAIVKIRPAASGPGQSPGP